MVKNIRLALGFGVILWFIGLFISFITSKFGYQSWVSLALGFAVPLVVICFSFIYISSIKKPAAIDVLKVGIMWWIINLLLDMVVKVPLFKLALMSYFFTYAFKYLGLIIIPVIVAVIMDFMVES